MSWPGGTSGSGAGWPPTVRGSWGTARSGRSVTAGSESDRPEVLAFLSRRGFTETMRMHRLVLNVADATLEPFAGVEPRLAADGITLTTLEDEQQRIGEASWRRLCSAYHAAREGWPDPDPDPDAGPDRPPALGEFRRRYERYARLLPEPEPCILAVHGEEVVGFTCPIGTGVRPELRGRGIATALKARVIAEVRERGLATLYSTTGNPAMLKVNERLGYRITTTEVRLVRLVRRLRQLEAAMPDSDTLRCPSTSHACRTVPPAMSSPSAQVATSARATAQDQNPS